MRQPLLGIKYYPVLVPLVWIFKKCPPGKITKAQKAVKSYEIGSHMREEPNDLLIAGGSNCVMHLFA